MPSSSTTTNLFLIFTERLERVGLAYVVTGSVAGIIYGEPRLTHDLDLVLALATADEARRLCAAFPGEEFYCAPEEVIRIEAQRSQRGHFNIIHHESGFKADIYLAGREPLHAWALAARRPVEVEGHLLWAAPPEYVILRKLEYYREGGSPKHLEDIRGMLRVSGGSIDRGLLAEKLAALGLQAQWEAVGTEHAIG